MKNTETAQTEIRKQADRRTFVWMPRLDFYVVREFLIPFSVLIFAFTLLFLIGDVFNDVDKFLEHDGAAWLAVEYFVLKIPGNIRFILPITVLLSCMYTLANFGRHREITAMRASGISLFRCSVPICAIAFCVMLVNFWFNETLIPTCTQKASRIVYSLSEKKSGRQGGRQASGNAVQYPTTDNRRNWMFGKFDSEGTQYNVRLKFFELVTEPDGTAVRRTVRQLDAASVEHLPGKGWVFRNCEERKVAPNGLPYPPVRAAELVVPSSDAPETPDMILKAISEPEMLSAFEIFEFLRENPNLPTPIRRIYETYFYQHVAFPWACFLCAFLALPLAAKNERSGIFLAILIAVGVIVAYQVVSEALLLLGKNGSLPPVVAGLFPTAAFAAYGIFLARKSG